MSPRLPELRSDAADKASSYNVGRHTDPQIADKVHTALGGAGSLLNIRAGTTAYEPAGPALTAVDPGAAAGEQDPAAAVAVVAARPESLPFADDEFEAAMACLALHHWDDPIAGLRELRRVTSGPVVILALDLAHLVAWQRDYLAPVVAIERRRQPTIAEIAAVLGRRTRIDALRTPAGCEDGFLDAYWSRPEALLDPRVRAAQSAWSLISRDSEREIVDRLRADLASGAWDEDHGYLRQHRDHDGALRLIVSPR